MPDHNEWQGRLDGAKEHDHAPVTITYGQAMKIGAVIDAFVDGHTGYADAVKMISQFVQASALEKVLGEGAVKPCANDLWDEINQFPWPVAGGPKPQPDVDD